MNLILRVMLPALLVTILNCCNPTGKIIPAKPNIALILIDNEPNGWRWNDGMKGRKGSTDEGGVRVPMFIKWEGQYYDVSDKYPEFIYTQLPARDGTPHGNITRSNRYPNCSFFSNWKNTTV